MHLYLKIDISSDFALLPRVQLLSRVQNTVIIKTYLDLHLVYTIVTEENFTHFHFYPRAA